VPGMCRGLPQRCGVDYARVRLGGGFLLVFPLLGQLL